ncbi:MAG: hypothetical protein VX899_27670 [Myxococcota bacterium]|nr:hypothetical protein [Myxococcota bacterium]
MPHVLLLTLFACKAPDPAPTEIEELSRFFINHYEDEEPQALADGANNLDLWYQDNVGEGDLGGLLDDLLLEDIVGIGMPQDTDPDLMVGVFHLTPQQCSLDDIAGIFLYDDQQELFPDSYITYGREYKTDTECFRPGDCDDAHWDINIKTALALGTEMTYTLDSGMVRTRPDADGDTFTEPFLMSRTWLPEPAEVDGVGYFDQSYQIEVFLPTGSDTTLHFYALWNAGGVDGLDPEADFWKDQYLDSIIEWDERIDELCAEPALWQG